MKSAKNFWAKRISEIECVSEKQALLLYKELGLKTFEDLLHFFPKKYGNPKVFVKMSDLVPGQDIADCAILGTIGVFFESKTPKRMLRAMFTGNNKSVFEPNWFNNFVFLKRFVMPGSQVLLCGKLFWHNGRPKMINPDLYKITNESDVYEHLCISASYREKYILKKDGIDSAFFKKIINIVLAQGQQFIEETLPVEIIQKYNFIDRYTALKNIHNPESESLKDAAIRRLQYEELFVYQTSFVVRKEFVKNNHKSAPVIQSGELLKRFYDDCIPFDLTNAQKRVVREIYADLKKTNQMNRLVQGDVGSGKTMVALMSMIICIDNGFQTALIAPTQILAEQHYRNFKKYLGPMMDDIGLEMLCGTTKQKDRNAIAERIKSGVCKMIIGTHALIEDWVQFDNLGLVVIDEQHKFGVEQRSKLWKKSRNGFAHNLAISATPIPRTLALSAYGDIDISVIDELPPGRKPPSTHHVFSDRRKDAYEFIRREIMAGRQAYLVFPLINKTKKSVGAALEDKFEDLCKVFNEFQIGKIHSRMTAEEKEKTMLDFKNGDLKILASTTVIEVGVDVPNASVMLIEDADRFGLSQLHQLRGRVGRGADKSYTLLVTKKEVSSNGQKRMEAMVSTYNGFEIAEIDLKLRGQGDLLGTKQSGLPEFQLSTLPDDEKLMEQAKDDIFQLFDEYKAKGTKLPKSLLDAANKYISRKNMVLAT